MSFQLQPKETIFIAGSYGMVGSAIKKELYKDGFNVNSKILSPTKEELNLTDFQAVKQWFKQNKPTIVIIAAAKVGGILANSKFPYDFILQNLKIQTNLIEISFLTNVKKLLFLGSSCIYPKLCKQPIKENFLLTDSLEKTNEFYAIAKIAGIKLCQSLMIQNKFNAICLMPTNLYGPRDNYHPQNSHVIPSLIRKFYEAKKFNKKNVTCWGTGSPLREFLHVDDLAKACLFLLKNWNPIEDIKKQNVNNEENTCWINVGTEYEISIKELAEKISDACGYEGKIIWDNSKPNGTPRKKLDTTKINSLGWYPKISLDEGIKLTLDAYIEERISNELRT